MAEERSLPPVRWYRTRGGQWLLIALGIGAVYGLTEHWEHALQALPWLFLLACPLMHGLLHGGHGAHGAHGSHGAGHSDATESSTPNRRQ